MKNQIINEITQQMLPVLNNLELEKLRTALNLCLAY
ncbi:unknown [Clostridium sp. CAG:715]|nr:unknown [Clostridium sp. CAG:715]